MVKIGMTTRSPEERAIELKSTGVPGVWNVDHAVFVPNCEYLEKVIHSELESFRVSNDREFFSITVDDAKETLDRFSSEMILNFPGWPDLDLVKQSIESELQKIRIERHRRLEEAKQEKQLLVLQREIEKKEAEKKRLQEIEETRQNELKRIDSDTKQKINASMVDGWIIFWAIVAIFMFSQDKHWYFGFGPAIFIFFLMKWAVEEKEQAKQLRKDHNLPDHPN